MIRIMTSFPTRDPKYLFCIHIKNIVCCNAQPSASFVDIPSFSRIDASNSPQQALMEPFVQGLSDVSMAKDEDGSFYPIEQWSILTMGSNGHVLRIFIESDDDSHDEDDDM